MLEQTTVDDASARGLLCPPAQEQLPSPGDELLHSGNCGLIVHRVGQINYEFRSEGRDFARTLQQHVHRAIHPTATTLLYEELFGVADRLHWLVHLRTPDDYVGFIHMSDHDKVLRQILEEDRLPEKGGGNWERMFAEASFHEHVLVPQHGVAEVDDDAVASYFVPPARHQTPEPLEQQLNSATAGLLILRSGQIRFELREEGRAFAYAWQSAVNRKLAGDATVYLYEETWGTQDRIYWLLHLRSFEAYQRLHRLGLRDRELRQVFTRSWVAESKGGGTWARLFVDGSLRDVVMMPHHEGSGGGWI